MLMQVNDLMDLSTKGTRGCFLTPWLFSPLLILMRMTSDVDAFPTNQPTMVQCQDYDYTYCNTTYQYCDPHNPQCLLCSSICHELHEDPHTCSIHCPLYYKNAIEASAKLSKSTTPLYDSTTQQTDLEPTSPGFTSSKVYTREDISELGAVKTVILVVGLIGTVIIVVVLILTMDHWTSYLQQKCQKCHTCYKEVPNMYATPAKQASQNIEMKNLSHRNGQRDQDEQVQQNGQRD